MPSKPKLHRNPDACPSCGVSYEDHLGLHGTCKRLQIAREALRDIIHRTSVARLLASKALVDIANVGCKKGTREKTKTN